MDKTKLKRCKWSGEDQLMIDYHDKEWGYPEHDDQKLFEFLILEGAQAGLSWSTILDRREGYLKAFDNFDVTKVVQYSEKKIEELKENPDIIRNKLKITSTVKNAKAFIIIQKEFGSFDKYIWEFVNQKPKENTIKSLNDIPALTDESIAISKALKKRGFSFVGPTIMYAFMQACGLVNDHEISCFRYKECQIEK
ncbi:MAG: DNA-3-methyladenine glycosylase 1 [Candidatus Heimdallarchaeota archaeon LC_3]|nr:MAG: DNA-3-methyladenine glycosylase 1 [Candidatus Heimdallarchaeota archaeon LC_3]